MDKGCFLVDGAQIITNSFWESVANCEVIMKPFECGLWPGLALRALGSFFFRGAPSSPNAAPRNVTRPYVCASLGSCGLPDWQGYVGAAVAQASLHDTFRIAYADIDFQ